MLAAAVVGAVAGCADPPPAPHIRLDEGFAALETISLTMALVPGWSVTVGKKSFSFKPEARVVLNKRVIPADGKLSLLFKSPTGKQQLTLVYDFGPVTLAKSQAAIHAPNRRVLVTREVHSVSVRAMFDTFVLVDGRPVLLDAAGDGEVALSWASGPGPLWSAALFAAWCDLSTEVVVVLPGHLPFVATLAIDDRERARWLAAALAERAARALGLSPLANTIWPL